MDIEPVGECALERGNIGDMRQQPKFDLAVVGGHQLVTGSGDESFANLPALFVPNRNVLQIGV